MGTHHLGEGQVLRSPRLMGNQALLTPSPEGFRLLGATTPGGQALGIPTPQGMK